MKIFKHKFFFISLCVVLALTAFCATLAGMGRADLLSDIVGTVTYPVRWVCAKCADGVAGFGRYFGASEALNAENESLRAELDALRGAADNAAVLEAENERLRAFYGMKAAHPNFTFEGATVIGRSSEKNVTVYLLDRGSAHGIEKNMPVVTEDGLVGYVSEVGTTFCKVMTVLSADTSVGVIFDRGGVFGVLSGTAAGCEVTDIATGSVTEALPWGVDVEVGDTLTTAGVGAVYPGGIAVGRVTSLSFDSYSRRLTVTVEPAAKLDSDLSFVMILTGTGEVTP